VVEEDEEAQGILFVQIGGCNNLRREDGEEEEEGVTKQLEVVEQGEAGEALTQDGHIIPRREDKDVGGGARKAEEAITIKEDLMETRFEGGDSRKKGQPLAGGGGDQAEVDGGEEGTGEVLDLANEGEVGEDKEDSVATAIPLSQGGRAPRKLQGKLGGRRIQR